MVDGRLMAVSFRVFEECVPWGEKTGAEGVSSSSRFVCYGTLFCAERPQPVYIVIALKCQNPEAGQIQPFEKAMPNLIDAVYNRSDGLAG